MSIAHFFIWALVATPIVLIPLVVGLHLFQRN
jgi:hypothetical protein